MARLMEILDLFLDHLREDNPHGLVLKGGTALAVHHLKWHRESEDLDFDAPAESRAAHRDIVDSLTGIMDSMVGEGDLSGFEVRKQGFASTDRYHMKVTLRTHRDHMTKIDMDFVKLPGELESEGQLRFYSAGRMFVTKLLTFSSRGAMKDLYDIAHLVRILEPGDFREPEKVAGLITRVLDSMDGDMLVRDYRRAFTNVDMRFRDLKERDVASFVDRTVRDLKTFRNGLLKGRQG